jgi:hydroxyacylglutathione hydrolase
MPEPLQIALVPMLKDNYAYLIHDRPSGATAILDPSEAEPGLKAAAARGWTLTHVLGTHHHNDHCGGNLGIKKATGAKVVGPAYDRDRIPGIDIAVAEKSGFDFAGHHAAVLFIPGHTKGHIAFHFPDSKAVFCGDTLFSIGCGRMFEGTPDVMWPSLLKLRAAGRPTIPATLGAEKQANPFLRADAPELKARFGGQDRPDHETFGAIRAAKDRF